MPAMSPTAPRVRVKLTKPQYLSEFAHDNNGWLAAGHVLDVSPETAERWVHVVDIAEYAPDEETARAKRREELQAELERIAAEEKALAEADARGEERPKTPYRPMRVSRPAPEIGS